MARPSLTNDADTHTSEFPAGNGGHRPPPGPFTHVRSVAIGAGVACAAGLALFLPVRYPSVVSAHATILPSNRWVLTRAPEGHLIASAFNYRSGMSEGFRVSTFSAGGSVYFTLHPSIVPGRVVAIGDTIGSLYSSDVAERLISLNGQLAAARSLLAVNATGQKSAVVNEAEQRLQFAKRRREEHRKVEERHQLLFDQHIIPQNEYDRVQNEANALEDEIALATSNLEAAQTGAKPEQLELAHTQIAALEGEIAAVQERAATFTLTAPIAGTVTPTYSGADLLTVTATEYVALIPIQWSDYPRVAATATPLLTFRSLSGTVTGTLISMNRELQVMNGREVLMATARLDASSADIMPGMLVQCRIRCTPLTAIQYGAQLFHSATASKPSVGTF